MRRGVDFAQAELATKVRGKYLRALEEEQFDMLPAQTYVKGFLRTYAEYLGLDGQLYVDEYNSRFVGTGDDHEPRTRRSAARPQRRHRRIETNVILLCSRFVSFQFVKQFPHVLGQGPALLWRRNPVFDRAQQRQQRHQPLIERAHQIPARPLRAVS